MYDGLLLPRVVHGRDDGRGRPRNLVVHGGRGVLVFEERVERHGRQGVSQVYDDRVDVSVK